MKKRKEIRDYDSADYGEILKGRSPKKLKDIGIKLPPSPPSQVVSIRLPTSLLNELRAAGSERDIPYQAIMKELLFEGLKRFERRA